MTKILEFSGAAGNRLIATHYGDSGAPVLLLHGGGQTRHSWDETAQQLVASGYTAIALDQRGHGDSAWVETGDYSYQAFAADLVAVAVNVADRFGQAPIFVGASLGGISGLLANAQVDGSPFSALVLVDITPKPNPVGVKRIVDFMNDTMASGFDDLDQAADAIAAYVPQRKRPRNLDGLAKNLRQTEDGRYRWHWDPAFMRDRFFSDAEEEELADAARGVSVPVLLVRGLASDLVGAKEVSAFRKLVPHARFTDVAEAGHMVAGDKNTLFADAVIDFITGLSWGG